MTNAEQIAQWKTDCDVIGTNLTALATSWKYYRLTLAIINGNPTLNQHPSAFYLHNFLLRGFTDSVIMGIRRQMDTDSGVVSLVNFLNCLKRKADVYTVDDCVKTFRDRALRFGLDPQSYEEPAAAVYAAVAADDGKKICARSIKEKKRLLRDGCDHIVKVSNKHVGHTDRTAADVTLYLDEMNDAVQSLCAVANAYLPLFTAGNSDSFGKVDVDSWLSLFEKPWLVDGSLLEIPVD